MAIDNNDLQGAIDEVNKHSTVIGSWSQKLFSMFYSPTPANVEVDGLDNNGNIITVNVPNKAQIEAEFDSWKASKEIYCSANRTSGWESSNGGDSFGIIGEFTENKGFTANVGTGLQSGSYIVIPKNGRYRVSLSAYIDGTNPNARLYIKKTSDNNTTSQDILLIEFSTLVTNDINTTQTDIVRLAEGEQLFYQISPTSTATCILYHLREHTFVTLEYLGE